MKSHQNPACTDACTVLAPMSPAIAKLLHQLQAEMLKETHGLDVVPAGAIVLPALATGRAARFSSHVDSTTTMTLGADHCNEDTYTKRHSRPTSWLYARWHPAHWRLDLTRLDSSGRLWRAPGGVYVMDDFGDLVEVTP